MPAAQDEIERLRAEKARLRKENAEWKEIVHECSWARERKRTGPHTGAQKMGIRKAYTAEILRANEMTERAVKAENELVDTQAALTASEAERERMRDALGFYADPLRYEGPNQHADKNDKFSAGPYRQDVTKDHGHIARGRTGVHPMTPEKPRHDGEWVRVPREPTEEMLAAAEKAAFGWPMDFGRHYKAMLAASPATVALGTQEGEAERLKAQLADYEEAYREHQANVLRLDIALNGECAARAPLLIDILGQVEDLARKHGPVLASHARTIEALRAALEDIVATGLLNMGPVASRHA